MANDTETLADIVAQMRNPEGMGYTVGNTADGADISVATAICVATFADRIEAAWKREREALMPKPDPDWKAICEKCHDGDIEPDCEYYGEPNGCNSPIYGEHPKAKSVGNAAAMREALMRIKHLFRDINLCEDTLGNEAYAIADAALAAPPRNCDRPECEDTTSAQLVWAKEDCGKTSYYEWLLAPAAERKGDGDGR